MFYVFSYFTSTHTSVYEVIHGTIAINNSYTGLALRSETIVPSDYAGDINYYVKDASKVGANDLIYSVDTDGSISKQINSANEDASFLSKENLDKLQNSISVEVILYRWSASEYFRCKDSRKESGENSSCKEKGFIKQSC